MSLLLHPVGRYVFARLLPDPEATPGGIVLPQVLGSDQEQAVKGSLQRAVVVSVSAGYWTRKGYWRGLQVQPGDEVLLARYMGTEMRFDGVPHVCIEEENITAVLE